MTSTRRHPPVLLVLAAAAALAAGCGGSGTDVPPPVVPPAGAAPEGKLVRADALALAGFFRERLAATADTAGGTGVAGGGSFAFAPLPVAATEPTAGAEVRGDAFASPLLLQEADVDEADVVRTDGDLVYALAPALGGSPQRVDVLRAGGGGAGLVPTGTVPLLADRGYQGLFVDAPRRRLLAIGSGAEAGWGPMPMPMPMPAFGAPSASLIAPWPRAAEGTVVMIDVADPAVPRVTATLSFDGSIAASRVHSGRLWLVVRSTPRFEGFDWGWAPASATANRAWLAGLSAETVLPTWRVDAGPPRPLVAGGDCYLQPEASGRSPQITTLVSIDLAAPLQAPVTRCLAAPVETTYMTADAIYLAATRHPAVARRGDTTVAESGGEGVTDVHKFTLSAGTIAYRGSGSAPGRLNWGADTARFMVSARDADLRMFTQRDTTASQPSPATLTVLRDGGDGVLRTVATLPNARRPEPIGKPGERVHGVRFVGDRAYAVTFRRIDPLYVIDLADAADPRLLGALEVPGFSDRLYPLNDRLLLGVGHDSTPWQGADVQTSVLVSLIDVSDPARPIERDRRTIGKRGSSSASDHSPHGTMLRSTGGRFRIALPVDVHETAAPFDEGAPDPVRWRGFTRLETVRFEVDPAAPSLQSRTPVIATAPLLEGTGATRWRAGSPAFDRAIDIGDTTWFWYDGRFEGGVWR
jgi:hypothetical protein